MKVTSLLLLVAIVLSISTVSSDYIIDSFDASGLTIQNGINGDTLSCNPAQSFGPRSTPNITQYVTYITNGNATITQYNDLYCTAIYPVPSVFGGYRRNTIQTITDSIPYTPKTPSSIFVNDGLFTFNVGADLPVAIQIQYQGNHNADFTNCTRPQILCPNAFNDLGPYIQPGIDLTQGGRNQALLLVGSTDHIGTQFRVDVFSRSNPTATAFLTATQYTTASNNQLAPGGGSKRNVDDPEYDEDIDGIVYNPTKATLSKRTQERLKTISKKGVQNALNFVFPFNGFRVLGRGSVDWTSVNSITITIPRQVALDGFLTDFRAIPLISSTKTGVVVDSVQTDAVAEPTERVNFSIRIQVIQQAVDTVQNIFFYDNPNAYDNLATFDPSSVTVTGFLYNPVNCTNGTNCVNTFIRDNTGFNGSFVRFANGSLVAPNAIAFFTPAVTSGSYLIVNYSMVVNNLACAVAACPSGCQFSTQAQYSAGTCICTRNTGYLCYNENNPTNTISQINQAFLGTLPSNTSVTLAQRCQPSVDVATQTNVTSLPVGAIPNPAVTIRSNPTDKINGLLPGASTTFTITLTNNRTRASDAFTLRVTPDANLVCGYGAGSANPTFTLDSQGRYARSFPTGLAAQAAAVIIPLVCNVSSTLTCGVNNTVIVATIDFGANTQTCPEDITADDTSSDNVPLIGAPSLSVTKSNANTIILGSAANTQASFTITVSNSGTRTATNVVIVDTLPAALTSSYQSSDNPSWTASGSNQYSYTIATIAANGQVQIPFIYRIPSTATDCVTSSYPNSVSVSGTCGGSATANATVNFVATPDIAVSIGTATISPSASNPAPNSVVCYPINYQNLGYRAASSATLSVVVPTGTTFNSQQSASGFTRSGTTNTYTLTVSTVPAYVTGQSPTTVQFCVSVNANVSCGATIATSVSATIVCPGFPETNFANNNGVSANLPISGSITLSLSKTAAVQSIVPGSTVAYSIRGSNSGTQQATGVTVTESVPAGMTAGTNNGWTFDASRGLYTYQVGVVAAGAAFGPITFNIVAPSSVSCPAPTVTNFATVTETCLGQTANASSTLPFTASPTLTLTASNTTTVVLASSGNQACVTACYTNTGNQVAANSTLTMNIPQYATFVSSSSYVQSGSSLTYSIGNIAVGANVCAPSACFTITSPIPCGVNNVAFNFTLSSPCAPGQIRTANTIVNIIASPVLQLTKTNDLAGADARPGQTVTYSLSYRNVGFRIPTDVVLTENVPTYLTAATNNGWTCSGSVCTRSIGTLTTSNTYANASFVAVVSQNIPGRLTVNNTATIASTICASSAVASSVISVAGFPNLVISKTDFGITVNPGEYIYYSISYSNIGDTSADRVIINETVPSFTKFSANLSSPGWSCMNGAGAGMQCVYTVGVLNRAATGTVRFVVKVDDWVRCGVNSIANVATIQSLNPTVVETNYNDNSATENTPLQGYPDLVIYKETNRTFGARYDRAGSGDLIVYNITYTNVGVRDGLNVMIYETVPEYTTFDSSNSSPSWNCSGTVAGSLCTFSVGQMYPTMMGMDSTMTVEFAVRVVSDLPPWAHVTNNCVEINNTCDDCNMFNNMACYPVNLFGTPDLAINQTAYCQTIHWYVEWSNQGDQAANNVVITDTIPMQSTFNAARSDSRWTCDQTVGSLTFGQCTINVGSLNSGAGGSAVFVTNPISGSTSMTFTNRATATGTGNNPDPTPDNNSDSATVGYEGCPDSCDSCCPTVDECCPDKTEVVFQFGGLLNGIDKCNSS